MKYNSPINAENVVGLALADGCIWDIIAADDRAYDIISAITKIMQLKSPDKSAQRKSRYSIPRRLVILVEDPKRDSAKLPTTVDLTVKDQDFICILTEPDASLTDQYKALMETEGEPRFVELRNQILQLIREEAGSV